MTVASAPKRAHAARGASASRLTAARGKAGGPASVSTPYRPRFQRRGSGWLHQSTIARSQARRGDGAMRRRTCEPVHRASLIKSTLAWSSTCSYLSPTARFTSAPAPLSPSYHPGGKRGNENSWMGKGGNEWKPCRRTHGPSSALAATNRQRKPSHPPFLTPPDPSDRQGSIIRRKRDMTPSHQPLTRKLPHVSYRNLITLANMGRLPPRYEGGESPLRATSSRRVPPLGGRPGRSHSIHHPPAAAASPPEQDSRHGTGWVGAFWGAPLVRYLISEANTRRPWNQVRMVPESPRGGELTDGPNRSVPVR